MQINNVISGLTDLTTLGKKNESTAAAADNALKPADAQSQTSQSTRKASAEILRNYDVTRITPDQFMQMVQKLYKAGVLTEKDYQELLAARVDLEKAGIEADESVNMLEFYSDKLNTDQKEMGGTLDDAARQQNLGADMRRLDWLQKFAVIQANPDAAGLDVAA